MALLFDISVIPDNSDIKSMMITDTDNDQLN